MPLFKPRPIFENENSAKVYRLLLEAGEPMTVLEILRGGAPHDGTLYSLIQSRVDVGILTDGMRDGTATYDLTPEGYRRIRPHLQEAGVSEELLQRADARFAVPTSGAHELEHGDAPYCMQCGVQMVRAGSIHACPSCGATSGDVS